MQFVTEDIDSYVSRKRNNHVHGNHIEIQAISELFNRPVEIYAYHTGEHVLHSPPQIQLPTFVTNNCWSCRTGEYFWTGANQRGNWATAIAVSARLSLQCNFESIQTSCWPWLRPIRLSNYRRIAKREAFARCGARERRFGHWADHVRR